MTARSKAIDCDLCHNWTHIKCNSGISSELYDKICNQETELNFICNSYTIAELPQLDNDDSIIEDHSTYNKLPSSVDSDYFQCFQNKGLHFIHLNARSLLPKITEIRHIALKTKAVVISVTETWLDQSVTDGEIQIQNYTVIRKDRNRQGGGVCVYIREDHAFNLRTHLNNDDAEFLLIELLLPRNKPIYIGTIYRPPKQTDFLQKFETVLKGLRSDCETYILGDFNICFLQTSSSLFKEYYGILILFNLDQVITEPTRLCNISSSVLDHILCNNKEKIPQSGVLPVGLSNHLITFLQGKQ